MCIHCYANWHPLVFIRISRERDNEMQHKLSTHNLHPSRWSPLTLPKKNLLDKSRLPTFLAYKLHIPWKHHAETVATGMLTVRWEKWIPVSKEGRMCLEGILQETQKQNNDKSIHLPFLILYALINNKFLDKRKKNTFFEVLKKDWNQSWTEKNILWIIYYSISKIFLQDSWDFSMILKL